MTRFNLPPEQFSGRGEHPMFPSGIPFWDRRMGGHPQGEVTQIGARKWDDFERFLRPLIEEANAPVVYLTDQDYAAPFEFRWEAYLDEPCRSGTLKEILSAKRSRSIIMRAADQRVGFGQLAALAQGRYVSPYFPTSPLCVVVDLFRLGSSWRTWSVFFSRLPPLLEKSGVALIIPCLISGSEKNPVWQGSNIIRFMAARRIELRPEDAEIIITKDKVSGASDRLTPWPHV